MDNFWEWTGVDGSEREWLRCRGGDDEARGGVDFKDFKVIKGFNVTGAPGGRK